MQEDERGNLVTQHVAGTAEDARSKVRAYFDDLRETVNRQEEAGLAVVNNYVREKLLSLRQQQEDMAVLMSQVTSVCVECDRALKRSDAWYLKLQLVTLTSAHVSHSKALITYHSCEALVLSLH